MIQESLEAIVEIIDKVVSTCNAETCEEFKKRVIEEINNIE